MVFYVQVNIFYIIVQFLIPEWNVTYETPFIASHFYFTLNFNLLPEPILRYI